MRGDGVPVHVAVHPEQHLRVREQQPHDPGPSTRRLGRAAPAREQLSIDREVWWLQTTVGRCGSAASVRRSQANCARSSEPSPSPCSFTESSTISRSGRAEPPR